MPARIEVLEEDPSRTSVYRVHLKGAAGTSVIAKRSPCETARAERTVYERILPDLGLPGLHYYGSAVEPAGDFCWLFMEEATGRRYRPRDATHRTAAARWLAALHLRVRVTPASRSLPTRHPEHYRKRLDLQRTELASLISGTQLAAQDRQEVGGVVAHWDDLAARWTDLEEACGGLPDTLVHGDLVEHNLVVYGEPSGLSLRVFDWEKAGWGTPAEDLSGVDLDAYWEAIHEVRTGLDLPSLKRLARAGRIFRCIVFLDWVVSRIEGPERRAALENVALCRSWLDQLVATA